MIKSFFVFSLATCCEKQEQNGTRSVCADVIVTTATEKIHKIAHEMQCTFNVHRPLDVYSVYSMLKPPKCVAVGFCSVD